MPILTRMLAPYLPVSAPLSQTGSSFNTLQSTGGLIYLGANPTGGPVVTEDNATELSAVYRCIAIIAETCGALELKTYDIDSTGMPVYVQSVFDRHLWDRPNPEMTRAAFWTTAFAWKVATGNAYLYAVTGASGLVVELWPLASRRVKVGRSKDGRKVYLIDNEIPEVDIAYGGNVIQIPGFGFDGLQGLSPIRSAAISLGLARAAEEYAARTFSQGSTPGGVIQTDSVLTGEQAEALSTRWERYHRGLANSHRTAVLDRGAKYTSVSINPEDAQLLETRKFQTVEIGRWFGVPPHLIGDVERSTSWGTGIEEQGRGFVTYTLNAHIEAFQQVVSDTLLGGTSRYVRWDTSPLLRGNLASMMGAYKTGIEGRIIKPNEARAELDMPPYEGGDDFQSATLSTDDVNSLGVLVRAGFDPVDSAKALGFPPIKHSGNPPVTVQAEARAEELRAPINVPSYISANARRGLAWNADGLGGDGLVDRTLREARMMADGSVSEDKVRRMSAWFARHLVDLDRPQNSNPDNDDYPGPGAVAWALWGGSPTNPRQAMDWADAKVAALDRAEE